MSDWTTTAPTATATAASPVDLLTMVRAGLMEGLPHPGATVVADTDSVWMRLTPIAATEWIEWWCRHGAAGWWQTSAPGGVQHIGQWRGCVVTIHAEEATA